ncbi:MAG TPA: BTAD domain-containing putative transcriptional regulator [Acetobacteraceae bacterium]|nr:BTAD domain-containing putative transcriptional regulator [Acetobacteraceae bacterium]
MLRVTLLGVMQAQDAVGQSMLPRSRKARAVLALLAAAAPRPILRAQIIALLWSRREREQASGSLRQSLHELQGALGALASSVLVIDRQQIALAINGVEVDLNSPGRATAEAARWDRVRFLDDLNGIDPAFDEWLAGERLKLAQQVRAWAEQALQAAVAPDEAIRAAETLIAIDSGHEAAWQALIRARLDQGDRSAAVSAFERCRVALAERMQLAPSAATNALLAEARVSAPAQISRSESASSGFGLPAGFAAIGPGRPDRLRLGVTQFRGLLGEAAGGLVAGLVEELIAGLARFRWIACVPVSSLAPILEAGTTRPGAWQQLGLDFLLDGALQQSKDQVRVIMRVLDLHNGCAVAWSAQLDRRITGIFELQEEIAAEALAQLEPKLLRWESERIVTLQHGRLAKQDLVKMTLPGLFRVDRSAFQEGGRTLERALDLDPENPFIQSWVAQWHLFALGQGWVADVADAAKRARELADRAADLAPEDARALTLLGHVRGFIEGRPDEALALHERAIQENPNLTLAWSRSALAHSYAGQHQEALHRATRISRLSSKHPLGFLFEGARAVPHLLLGEYAEAATAGLRAIALNPGFSSSYKTQLAALGHLGRREEAAEVRARLLALEPGFSVSQALERSPIRLPEDRARYAEGLRLGGLT